MKRYILLFSIVFSITVGYSQNDSIPIKDSVQKDKKYYREKAKNFMINTFGKENFENHFKINNTSGYRTSDSSDIKDNDTCYPNPFLCTSNYLHRSYKINIDKRYRVAPLDNCDFVIFSYYLKFNYKYYQSNYPPSDYSAIKLIFDVRKDSFYIYQPERIPTFIKNKDTNNFISNDRLQDIIQKHQFKNATSGEEELAPITNIRYSSKTNSFVFEILNFLKIKHDGRITKLGIIVVDAYTGEILEIFTTHKQNLEGCVNNNMHYD